MRIRKIQRRDSLDNGILIGLGIGAGVIVAACKTDPDPEDCTYIVYYFALPAIGAGATIGAIVDLVFNKTLYRLVIVEAAGVERERSAIMN